MGGPTYHSPWSGTVTFATLIKKYIMLQSNLVKAVRSVGSSISQVTPGAFLLLQFQMSQVTQIGETISNLVSQLQAVVNNSTRNQKST
jgi:hypothetical protein